MTAHIVIWRDAVLVLAAAPLAYYALGTLVALRFFRRERARTLPNYTSPASILKPVRGVDFGSYENFASFCRQEYPDYEILFAVNDGEDPAVPVIQRTWSAYVLHLATASEAAAGSMPTTSNPLEAKRQASVPVPHPRSMTEWAWNSSAMARYGARSGRSGPSRRS